jgi:hypothetical protein
MLAYFDQYQKATDSSPLTQGGILTLDLTDSILMPRLERCHKYPILSGMRSCPSTIRTCRATVLITKEGG